MNKKTKTIIRCGFCNDEFDTCQKLEYIAEPGKFANCCPNCGICDYEKGADFKEIVIPQKKETWINVKIKVM